MITSVAHEDDIQRLRSRIADLESELAQRAETKLADDEYRYSVELNPQVTWTADTAGAIEDFNQRWTDVTGLNREQTLGEGWASAMHSLDLPRMLAVWSHSVQTGEPYDVEHRLRLQAGGYRWMRSRAFARRNPQGQIVRWYGTTEDIHNWKETELLLKNSEHSFSAAFAEAPIGMVLLSHDGTLLEVNRAYRDMLGYSNEELLSKDSSAITHPDDIATTRRFFKELQNDDSPRAAIEKRYFHRDGRVIWTKASGTMRRDGEGRPMQVVAIVEDISDRKHAEAERERLLHQVEAERRRLEVVAEQLRRANRELEEFAYVSSHDLQEPLRMVNIYTQLILREMKPFLNETTTGFAQQVQGGVARMEQLLRDLLTFSRTIADDPGSEKLGVPSDLNSSVGQAVKTMQGRIEDTGAQVSVDLLPTVYGDPAQLAQVFQNLLSNALKYRKADELPAIHISSRSEGSDCVVMVRDNGIGFAQDQAKRIFGLFKRLHKDEYPGTGLGLAICKRIVERYGGQIWAESGSGEGATFFLKLKQMAL